MPQMKNLKVIILCGGFGTRLREQTESIPKPMVEIGGRPILWHIMKIYAHYGMTDFILSLGYKSAMIKDYFLNYETMNNDVTVALGRPDGLKIHGHHHESGWNVTLADTGINALKGARVKRVEKYVDGDLFMLAYGDVVANIDLGELLAFHLAHKRMGTVTGVRPPSRFGEITVDGDRIVSFVEKPQMGGGLINGGFFVFNREVFDYLEDDDNCDFERGPLEQLVHKGELQVFTHKRDWECMDTLRDMQYLNKLWEENRAFWKVWDDDKPGHDCR